MSAAKTKTKSKGTRNRNRKLLRQVRGKATLAALTTTPEPTNPTDAIQLVLDRAVAMLHEAGNRVQELDDSELMRDTMVGKIPNEWIRLEADLRHEVGMLAGRMLQLDIDGRKADTAAALGAVIAGVVTAAAEKAGLQLTDEFRHAMRGELETFATTGRPKKVKAA